VSVVVVRQVRDGHILSHSYRIHVFIFFISCPDIYRVALVCVLKSSNSSICHWHGLYVHEQPFCLIHRVCEQTKNLWTKTLWKWMMDLQTIISTYLTSNLMLLLVQISVVTYLQTIKCKFWSFFSGVVEDSIPLVYDTELVGSWILTYQRNVVLSSSRVDRS
jgi:hypothetical protein